MLLAHDSKKLTENIQGETVRPTAAPHQQGRPAEQ